MIDCSDCTVIMTVGARTRAAVYNEVKRFIISAIEDRGFSTNSEGCDVFEVEATARRLAERLIEIPIRAFDIDVEDDDGEVPAGVSARDAVEAHAREYFHSGAFDRFKEIFVEKELDALIARAFKVRALIN